LAAAWLQRKENYQWLDFGSSRQGVTPALLKIMVQRQTNFIRLYTSDADDTPIGIVALTNVDRNMRTGTFWIVAGDKSFRSRGWGRIAASRFLALAFRDLGLHTVNTWIVASLLAVAAASAAYMHTDAAARFSCGFEASWSACGFSQQAKAPDRVTLVEVAGRSGVRLRTLPGDRDIAGSGEAERADLALSPEASGCFEGQEQWWAHSLLFPSDYELP